MTIRRPYFYRVAIVGHGASDEGKALDAIRTLESVDRGLDMLSITSDNSDKKGLTVARIYIRSRIDAIKDEQGNGLIDRALPPPGYDGDEILDDDKAEVIDTQQSATGTFHPVQEGKRRNR